MKKIKEKNRKKLTLMRAKVICKNFESIIKESF